MSSTYVSAKTAAGKIIPGLLVIQPAIFSDERGHFLELFRIKDLKEQGIATDITQVIQSSSKKDVVRGMHFQSPPFDQGKLVMVPHGKIYDVVLDIRVGSPTYGDWFGVTLSAENHTQFWIPPGFAHGFVSQEDGSIVTYIITGGIYNKASEGGVRWNDPAIGINWPVESPIANEKDASLPLLQNFTSPFAFEA